MTKGWTRNSVVWLLSNDRRISSLLLKQIRKSVPSNFDTHIIREPHGKQSIRNVSTTSCFITSYTTNGREDDKSTHFLPFQVNGSEHCLFVIRTISLFGKCRWRVLVAILILESEKEDGSEIVWIVSFVRQASTQLLPLSCFSNVLESQIKNVSKFGNLWKNCGRRYLTRPTMYALQLLNTQSYTL